MLYSPATVSSIQTAINAFYTKHPLALIIAKIKPFVGPPINPLNPYAPEQQPQPCHPAPVHFTLSPVTVGDVLGVLDKDGITDAALPSYLSKNSCLFDEIIKSVQKQRINQLIVPSPYQLLDLGW